MADPEVEKEWEKSKRIEAERMKAMRDPKGEKSDKSNLTFLDPKRTKVKGWSKDPDVIIADSERMGNRALIFVIGGITLTLIGYVGSMVGEGFKLGMSSMIISELPSLIGMVLMGIGALMALATIGVEIYFRFKKERKIDSSFWTAVATIAVMGIYIVIRWAMARLW